MKSGLKVKVSTLLVTAPPETPEHPVRPCCVYLQSEFLSLASAETVWVTSQDSIVQFWLFGSRNVGIASSVRKYVQCSPQVNSVLCCAQSCLTLCHPMDCSLPGSSVQRDSPGKNTGVGCHAFFQGIFPTQVLNPGLLHCRRILYHKANSSRGHKNSRCLYIYEWNLEIYERKENPQLGSEILSLFSPQLNKLTKKSVSV